MDVNFDLARYVVQTKFEDLPSDVVEKAKLNVLDTLGVAVAGSRRIGGEKLMTLAEECGGKEESTIIGYGKKASAVFTTLVNASMAHALDYDDIIMTTGHIAVSIVPAAFAIAQRNGNISGKDLITAVVLGNDITCRLGAASIPLVHGPGWQYTPLYGIFGATAVAGKLLGLNENEMANAFGIAYSQASGNRQPLVDGALSKSIQAGFCSQSGVLSALLASKGVTGATNCFQGKFGMFNVYHRGEYFPEKLTEDLGKKFNIVNMQYKKFPCCTGVESSLEATVELVKEHGVKAEDVDYAIAHVGSYSNSCVEPLEVKQSPRAYVDAQFSVPWVVATALVKGKLDVDDMTEEAIHNQAVRNMAKKVTPVMDMEVAKDVASWPARVEVKMKDGSTFNKQINFATGHPSVPLSVEELTDKFRDNTKYGRKPVDRDTVEHLIKTILALETVGDVSEIITLLG